MDDRDQKDMEKRITEVEVQLKILTVAWQQAAGALALIKYVSVFVGMAWAIVVWLKDHVKI
jgi:hypothetical protein